MTEWIDITQPLNNQIAHWPEDEPFHYETAVTKEMSGSVNIGRMTMSAHIGTHIDAPFHYRNDGKRILDLDINRYIGRCQIIDIGNAAAIDRAALEQAGIASTTRLLVKTSLPNKPERFPEEVPGITPDGAACMKEYGVQLVGVDVPSVDPITSKTLDGHHALFEQDIYILENVMLDAVTPGIYELIALPLALEEADGSPTRAVIRPYKEDVYEADE